MISHFNKYEQDFCFYKLKNKLKKESRGCKKPAGVMDAGSVQ
jgi:hypothetical protein